MTVLVGLKIVLVLLVVGPWAWNRIRASPYLPNSCRQRHSRTIQQEMSALEDDLKGIGLSLAAVAQRLQRSMSTIEQRVASVDWLKVLKATFMLLFVAYPGEQ